MWYDRHKNFCQEDSPMHHSEEPITQETFPKAWRYAQRRLYWTRKKAVVRYLVTTVSQMLFFCAFTILAYGLLYELSTGDVHDFLGKTEGAVLSWEKFSAILFTGAEGQWEKLTRLGLFLYGVPLGASVTAALAVGLLYHPGSPRLPGTEPEKAKALLAMTRSLRSAREKKYNGVTAFCALVYGLIALGSAVFFYLHCHMLFTRPVIFYGLGSVGAILVYALCNLLMQLLLMPLWYSRVPESFCHRAEAYNRSFRK